MAISNRIISAIVDQNMGGIWDAMIEQKKQQLEILSNQQQNLYEEARSLKDRLLNVGATVPETSSSSDFEKAKNLPIAFVGDNLRNMEGMVKYSQGQVTGLEEALNEFNQGKALMVELGDTYANLEAVDQYGSDAYRNFMVEGGIDDVGGSVYSGIKGGTPYNEILYEDQPGSEMAQLFAQLTPKQKDLYETSTQFREGFQAGNTRDIAVQKNLQSLEIKQAADAIKSARKEDILNNMDRYQGLLDMSTHKLTSGLKAQLNIGGTSIGMMLTSLQAGDVDSYNEYMEQMKDNSNLSLIHEEIGTMLEAYKSGENYPVLNTLSGIYTEFQEMMDLEATFKEGMPTDKAYNSFINNARAGKFDRIDARFEDAAREYKYKWDRFNQFNASGLMPDEDDMINALELFEASEDLSSKQLAFLAESSGAEVDKMYREGFGAMTQAQLDSTLKADWDPDELGEYMDVFDEMEIAHQEYLAMGGDPDPPLNDGGDLDLINREISLANDRAKFEDVKAKIKAMRDHGFSNTQSYYDALDSLKFLDQSVITQESMVDFYTEQETARETLNSDVIALSRLLGLPEDEIRRQIEEKKMREQMKAGYNPADRSTFPGQFQK